LNRLLKSLLPLAVLCAACGTDPEPRGVTELRQRCRAASSFEILSLDPSRIAPQEVDASDDGQFHGYRVLARCLLDDVDIGRDVVSRVTAGMTAEEVEVDVCFNPRHGVKIRTEDGPVDVAICYECHWIQIYRGGAVVWSGVTDRTPEPGLTDLWTAEGCPVAD
jgi:hypothetical protein